MDADCSQLAAGAAGRHIVIKEGSYLPIKEDVFEDKVIWVIRVLQHFVFYKLDI